MTTFSSNQDEHIQRLFQQGNNLLEQKHFQEALPIYEQILLLCPENVEVYHYKGGALESVSDSSLSQW